MARHIVDTASFDRSADPQLSSPFFALLPAEIRNLIYLEFWNLCSTRQHVVKNQIPDEDNAEGFNEWSHVPCLVDPRAEDTRFDEYATSVPASAERNLWGKRLKSEWCLHWACEEQLHDVSKTVAVMAREMSLGESNEGVAAASGSQAAGEQTSHESAGSQSSTKTGLLSLPMTCKRM
jgi:hypothetical protein